MLPSCELFERRYWLWRRSDEKAYGEIATTSPFKRNINRFCKSKHFASASHFPQVLISQSPRAQYLRGNEFMSRLENDQRRRDASLREYRAHLEMIDTISRNGKTRDQREQDDRRAAAAHFKELWPAWEMPAAGSGSGSGKDAAGIAKPDEVSGGDSFNPTEREIKQG